MKRDEDRRSSDPILAELDRLRHDPLLLQYFRNHDSCRSDKNTAMSSSLEKSAAALVSEKQEDQLQSSLRAQRAFQLALQSMETCGDNTNVTREGRGCATTTTTNTTNTIEQDVLSCGPHDQARKEESKATDGLQDPAVTLQEKLELRDWVIQRLQKELDETRAMYEADIAQLKAAHMQSKQEADKKIAELMMMMQSTLVDHSIPCEARQDSGAFIEAVECKEHLWQEMYDSFQQASKEWKSENMRTMESIRQAAEGELRGIMGEAESLLEELQTTKRTLFTPQNPNVPPITAEVAEHLLQDERALLSSWETRLREHVRTSVKNAVHNGIKDFIRPLVESELLLGRRDDLHMPKHPSPVKSVSVVGGATKRGTTAATKLSLSLSPLMAVTTSPSPSPAKGRCGDAVPFFRQMTSQRRQRSSRDNTAAVIPDELSHGISTSASPNSSLPDGRGRPSWLNRFCY